MSTKKNGNKFIFGLAVAFVLPLSFYMIAKLLSKDKIHLPGHYRVERVNAVEEDGKTYNDTIYHSVADLSLTNQLGDKVTLNGTLGGRILVVDFIFTNCTGTCPRLTGNIRMLQKAFRRNPKMENGLENSVHFLSISVDPTRDTIEALRAYAERAGADHDHWWFLTGDKAAIYNYARNELGLAVGPGDGGAEDFIHTEKLVLIDAKRNIRGYYDGLDTVQIKKCADDIVLLTMEKEKKHRR
ncbi:SCO family protein [Nemorincola caseinilytica]|uniref:SCO family protein n=1 Tax=Nemorincola caseinilytica TaxID=2054315 RepID=A0ABP8NL97_9BACT